MSSIFEAGFKEFARLKRQDGLEVSDIMEGSRRAMRASFNREMDDLDSHLPYLASVGSVSPYIGLFGNVIVVSVVVLTFRYYRLVHVNPANVYVID